MIFYHGTNINQLHRQKLAAKSWLTADAFTAADFAAQRKGPNVIYVFWLTESDVEFVYLPNSVIPAYRLRIEHKPIAKLYYQDGNITTCPQ